ncbi:MAG: hypothetical protein JWP75_3148 [Frondihabitans sp.]|nr:hypothetical protein [Frondihabitans sp.]
MVKGLIVVIVAAVAFVVYALVDCLFTERFRFRALNKPVWALLIIVLPVVGALLWFGLGRRRRGLSGRRVVAPDDDPDFLGTPTSSSAGSTSNLDRETMDERIRRLEQELAEHDDDGTSGPGK